MVSWKSCPYYFLTTRYIFFVALLGTASTTRQCRASLMMISEKLMEVDRRVVPDTLPVPILLVPTLTCLCTDR